MNETDSSLFERNLSLFAERDALTAYHIHLQEFNRLHFCQTQKGELNIYQKKYGLTDYYHSQEGALDEAYANLQQEDLQKTQAIFFYGIGLGYFYKALSSWLQERPERQLVFLEDDLEVIARFLQTELATSLLQDSQVTLYYFANLEEETFRFYQLISRFINVPLRFLALPYYVRRKEQQSFALCYKILYDQSWITSFHNEYASGQSGFISNFYSNLLYLPEAYLASSLFGKFTSIPAIICGAGPSLEKHIDRLKTLSDRAIIFAGGSSLNVLSAHGCLPHFGLGIDPNPEQLHRLLTTHAFHIPFFYRQRFTHTAFQMVRGPKLYVPGSSNQLAAWFEQKLGLEGPYIDEGHNVVNFCTGIAIAMGCNPLIFIGMDLAFTTVQTYAKGIGIHPLWLGRSQPYAREKTSIVTRLSITGEPITTKWDWIAEAEWLSHYARKYPQIRMLNATEGGLGFSNIPNFTLQEVIEKELTRSYDFQGLLHTEIQHSRLHIDRPTIIRCIQEFKSSLERCRTYCIRLIEEEYKWANQESETTSSLYTPQAALQEHSLSEEIGYKYFLEILNQSRAYLDRAVTMGKRLTRQEQIHQIIRRYRFLIAAVVQHLNLMDGAVQQFIFSPLSSLEYPPGPPIPVEEPIKDPFTSTDMVYGSDRITEVYGDGVLKQETFYEQGQLHGPSRFYHSSGKLLSETWYVHGLKESESRQFYPSGALYSRQNFLHGTWHGRQEFFFDNGQPSLILHYEQGLLEGTVTIYNPSGVLIRELHYKKGERHGMERSWDNQGNMLLECHYQEGVPDGIAREWDFQHRLRREVMIHKFPNDFDLSVWNEQGKKIQSFQHGVEDVSLYFSDKHQQAQLLDKAVRLITNSFRSMIDEKQGKDIDPALIQNLAELEASVQQLHAMKEELQSIMDTTLKRTEEALQQYKASPNHQETGVNSHESQPPHS